MKGEREEREREREEERKAESMRSSSLKASPLSSLFPIPKSNLSAAVSQDPSRSCKINKTPSTLR
jgi:hypothetical protein